LDGKETSKQGEVMAEIAFDSINSIGIEFGLDGWTSKNMFQLMLTTEISGVEASLTTEQCSQLAEVLIEHVKEVSNDTQKDVT
jgi:hypothetical protein